MISARSKTTGKGTGMTSGMLRSRILLAACALISESAAYTLVVLVPGRAGVAPFGLFLVPGLAVQFLLSGGMSAIDGLEPEWRTDVAFGLGFLLNSLVFYFICSMVAKAYRAIRPVFFSDYL